jgi:hypothetical protein
MSGYRLPLFLMYNYSMTTDTEKPAVKEPTEKQIKLAQLIATNDGKLPKEKRKMSDLMIEAGYSPVTSYKPSPILKSETFQRLLDQYLPEKKVVKAHEQLITAGTIQTIDLPIEKTDEEIKAELHEMGGFKVVTIGRKKGSDTARVYYLQPDGVTRRGAVDMAYKLRGSYAPEKQEVAIGSVNIVKYTDE